MNFKYSYIVALCFIFLSKAGGQEIGLTESKKADTAAVNQLVNMPYYSIEKNRIIGNVSIIDPDDFRFFDNETSIWNALSGRVSGFISGLNSHGLGNAVVFIDGIPGSLQDIRMEEVEDIYVIKDAASAMMYGVNAGKNVILITTKRGKVSDPEIEVSVDQGFGIPIRMPVFLNSANYMELYNEALENDGLAPLYHDTQIQNSKEGNNPLKYPDSDYYNSDILRKTMPIANYQLNFLGGTDTTRYYLTAGWERSGSYLKIGENENSNRLNIRSNLDMKVNSFINTNIDILGVYNIDNSSGGDFWDDASALLPNIYPPLIDISNVSNEEILSGARLIEGKYFPGGTSIYQNNLYANLHLGGFQRNVQSLMQFSPGLDLNLSQITPGLKFKSKVNFTYNTFYQESQNNGYAVYKPEWETDDQGQETMTLEKIGEDQFSGSQNISNTSKYSQITTYGLFDYKRNFGNQHALNAALIGYYNINGETGYLYERKFAHAGINGNYAFRGKYLANVGSALLHSPKFSPGRRSGLSYSIGAGWIISNEGFFSNIDIIDFLKIKVSSSVVSTDIDIDDYYLYETTLNKGNNVSWKDNKKSNSSTVVNTIGNEQLSFEKRIGLNYGIEAVIFDKSLSIDLNFFKNRMTDQIAQLETIIPMYYGGIIPYTNYKEDVYNGFDVGGTYRNKFNDFHLNLGVNFTYLKSKVVKTDEIFEYDYLSRIGKRVDGIYALEADGLFHDDNDIASHEIQGYGPVRPGDIKYVNQNDDEVIDNNDVKMIGNSFPDFSGGIHVSLGYRNLTLFIVSTGQFGSETFFNNPYYWVYGERKYSEEVLNRWTPQNADNASYPRLSSDYNNNNFRNSSYWLYDNSRITIDRIQLTYNLKEFSSTLKMKNLGVYMRASNVAMFAKNREKIQLNFNSAPQSTFLSVGLIAGF